jgi:hypothetical protein
MSLLKKGSYAKSQSPGSRQSGLCAESNGFSSGTEGLTSGSDRLCAESLLTQLSAKEPSSGPLVSSVPRAESPALGTGVGPTSVRGHPMPRLCREPPTGSQQISADLSSMPRAFSMTLGTGVGPATHAVSCEWPCDES